MFLFQFLFLAKRIPSSNAIHKSHRHLHPRFFSAASTTQKPDPKFTVADYLISSLGFSHDSAARASKPIASLKTPQNPDSVCRLLKDHGFSEADIKRLITWHPKLLCASPQKTLLPNLSNLRDTGLSTSVLHNIILSNPTALVLSSAATRIAFWMGFLGGKELALVNAFIHNRGLITRDITSSIAPKISLLQSHGFSNVDIQMIVCKVSQFITSRTNGMEDLLNRAKELGFQPGSRMFHQGLKAMVANTRDALQKKMEFLMGFGWSEEEFLSALRNTPRFIENTEKNLQAKMDFLMGEASCDVSYIASHAMLLNYSLERRLRPRNNVLRLLETKGLCQKQKDLYSAICMSDIRFAEKYIISHKEIIPELEESFTTACVSGSG